MNPRLSAPARYNFGEKCASRVWLKKGLAQEPGSPLALDSPSHAVQISKDCKITPMASSWSSDPWFLEARCPHGEASDQHWAFFEIIWRTDNLQTSAIARFPLFKKILCYIICFVECRFSSLCFRDMLKSSNLYFSTLCSRYAFLEKKQWKFWQKMWIRDDSCLPLKKNIRELKRQLRLLHGSSIVETLLLIQR